MLLQPEENEKKEQIKSTNIYQGVGNIKDEKELGAVRMEMRKLDEGGISL